MATKPEKQEQPVSTGNLPFALQRLEKLLGGASNSSVTITALDSKTLVSIQAQGSTAEMLLPARLPGLDATWDFPFSTLSAALHNRASAEVAFSGGQMDIKDKRYKATLQGVESKALIRVEKPVEPTCSVKVTADLWAALGTMTSQVKVSKSLAAMPDITVHYLFSKKTALAVAFDRFQMAAYALPNTFGVEFELTLPLSKAESLFKNGVGVTSILATNELLYVKAGTLSYSTSLPSVEDTTGVPVEAVVGRIKTLRSTNFQKQVAFPKVELQNFLGNARAISNANALLKVSVSAEKLTKLTLSSEGNSVSATVPSQSKKAFQFKLDIGYVNTIVSKSPETIQLEVDDSTLIFRTENLVYASVLSVDDEEPTATKKKASDKDED